MYPGVRNQALKTKYQSNDSFIIFVKSISKILFQFKINIFIYLFILPFTKWWDMLGILIFVEKPEGFTYLKKIPCKS